ncbi:hypothetical protein COHA_009119 [Chlorella ohadii]|uniref:Uncharacterized protein n=1 Tax=Chlorella ohadii TaxID=2649997 RepID=A0AAD5DG20_9CHLO|nr:hypothetical protein COHA_009119 [Chlorella ohadii]
MGSLQGLLEGQKWAELVKVLDAALPAAGGDRRQLLLNRAFCLQQLGLLRKALKDYEAVLEDEPAHVNALLHKAKVLVALRQGEVRPDANQGVGLAVQMVNTGQCKEAITLLDLLLQHHPGNVGAFAARGTAKALMHRLQEAVEDFSAAIELEPRFHDFHKRRGQALMALGEDEGAARDLRSCIQLAADGHEELGRLFQKQKDYRRAEAEFQAALRLAPGGPTPDLLSALGLCQEGIATYERALQQQPDSKDLWLNLGMALKELCAVERAREALRKAAKLARSGPTAVHAYRLLAQMAQGLGDHLGAVRELNRGISATDKEVQRIEMRFLRGACHHAVGLHRQAVDDYQQTLEAQGTLGADASQELVSFICLAFYQTLSESVYT